MKKKSESFRNNDQSLKFPFLKIIKSEFFQDIKNVLNFKKSAVLFSYVVRLKVLSSYILIFANVVFVTTYIVSLFLNSASKYDNNNPFTIGIFFWIAVVFNLLVYAIYIILNSWFSRIIKTPSFTKNLLVIVFLIFLSFIILIFLVTPQAFSNTDIKSSKIIANMSIILSIFGVIFIFIFIFTNHALDWINNKQIKNINFKITKVLEELKLDGNNGNN